MEREDFEKLIEAVKVMPLRPTDKIVLKLASRISDEQRASMRNILEGYFPGHKVLVIDAGMDIEIVRPES